MREKIKNLKSTERGRLKLKFLRYVIFLIAILIFLVIGNSVSTTPKNSGKTIESDKSENSTLSYLDKQKILYEGTYRYKFTVKSDDRVVSYNGESNSGVRTGYKETSDDIIKYRAENGVTYTVMQNEEIVTNDLYGDFNKEFFDFKSLFEKLNKEKSTISRSDVVDTYTYNLEYTCNIYVNVEHIDKIEISSEKVNYEFIFEY